MRLLHMADLHIGAGPAIGATLSNGLRERENDIFRALDRVTEEINARNIDTLVISGDIYDSPNPSSTARRAWSEWLTQMLHKTSYPPLKRIFVVDGNHDQHNAVCKATALQPDSTHVDWGQSDRSHPRFPVAYFAHEPSFVVAADDEDTLENMAGVILIPYSRDLAATREKIIQFYQENENYVDTFVIVAHMEIQEAKLGVYDTVFSEGFSINDEIFSHPKLRYVALGHIHKSQAWIHHQPEDARLDHYDKVIAYSGSLISKDFTDANQERSVYTVTINQQDVEHFEKVFIPDRNFVVIDNNRDIDSIQSDVVKGAFVKLRYTGTPDELRAFNIDRHVDRMTAMGAFHVKKEVSVQEQLAEDEVFASEDLSALPLPAVCEQWIANRAPEWLDKKRLAQIAMERLM